MKKYSQYGEEHVFINYFNDKKDGLVVDIGAADGKRYSNSLFLIENGWDAILVEPNIKNFNKLEILHKDRNNINLINEACGSETKNTIMYCDKNDNYEQLSTLSQKQMENCKKIYNCDFYEQTIKVTKTSELFERFGIKYIDLLSIDTEMLDYDVLCGIDFGKVDIGLICVEHNNSDIKNFMLNNGYKEYTKTLGNVFYNKLNK